MLKRVPLKIEFRKGQPEDFDVSDITQYANDCLTKLRTPLTNAVLAMRSELGLPVNGADYRTMMEDLLNQTFAQAEQDFGAMTQHFRKQQA